MTSDELEPAPQLDVPTADERPSLDIGVRPGDEHLWALGFPAWHEVQGRRSVADLHRPGERCGIYVLGFANGERYVGKAVDVVNRFTQHRKNHPDITHLTFQRVPEPRLLTVERDYIHRLEAQGLQLRNIEHMSVVAGERDLDLVVSPEEQSVWLNASRDGLRDAQEHVQDASLRRRYHTRFQRFLGLPYAQDALWLLGLYLGTVIPFPRRTELSFWSVTCLPDTGAPEGSTLLFRVNVQMQEVFALFADEEGLWGSFHLASSPYLAALGPAWPREVDAVEGYQVSDHRYAPGGQDQFNLTVGSLDHMLLLLTDWTSTQAMCAFNLNLMRKGATYFGRYHCLDLVDAAEQTFEARQEEFERWVRHKEIRQMSFDPVPGILHIEEAALPAQFDPSSWTVEAADPAAPTDPEQEYAVRFEAASPEAGTITGFATYLRHEDGAGAVYAVRLTSVHDLGRDDAE